MNESEFLLARDVAPRLGVSLRRTYQLIEAGALPVVRRGRRMWIPVRAFNLWLDTVNATALAAAALGTDPAVVVEARHDS
jgi:excisionase family DNA binding protein